MAALSRPMGLIWSPVDTLPSDSYFALGVLNMFHFATCFTWNMAGNGLQINMVFNGNNSLSKCK